VRPVFRSSQRITITLPDAIAHSLMQRSIHEGRSLSNLAAFLIEALMQPRCLFLHKLLWVLSQGSVKIDILLSRMSHFLR
jgi:hypothetical protein